MALAAVLFSLAFIFVELSESGARTIHTKNGRMQQEKGEEKSVEPPLFIGSFNIQTFGPKKYNDRDAMFIIEKVIERYDMILILELMFYQPHFMENLLKDLNRFSQDGTVYNMTLSTKHPKTTEHYAIFYKTNKLKVFRTESYVDKAKFYRDPLVVVFDAFTLRDTERFAVIGHHVKPSDAVQEIDALAGLYDAVKTKYGIQDAIIMGDFNADCNYVKENDWANISLWTRQEFTWAIPNHMDTTTNYRSCALDRIVYAGENFNNGVILRSAKVFNFQEEYDLSLPEAQKISDHWPIEIKVRGKTSKEAEKHLTSDICFTVRDSRPRSNYTAKYVVSAAKRANFEGTVTSDGIVLKNITSYKRDVAANLKELNSQLPGVMRKEMVESIKYKCDHGSLEDESSYADIPETSFGIRIVSAKLYTYAVICKTTTLN